MRPRAAQSTSMYATRAPCHGRVSQSTPWLATAGRRHARSAARPHRLSVRAAAAEVELDEEESEKIAKLLAKPYK